MTSVPCTIEIGLVSHTNAGKTTLARTLLGRDIGEVRDAPHVTDMAQSHVLMESAERDVLLLWDTPGFGDSARLVKRLHKADNPIGWLLREVWDRYRNRPLWCSQQAVRTVRESADLVLYLANAAEDPADAAYVGAEMQILSWIGTPVLLLLNQVGPPRSADREQADVDQWRAAVAPYAIVSDVLALDAFARCWVQEGVLLRAVLDHLPHAKRPAMERLIGVWRARNLERFEQAMGVLGRQLAAAAQDSEPIATAARAQGMQRVLGALRLGGEGADGAREQAMARLAARTDEAIRAATDRLIALHDLDGSAASVVLERLRTHYRVTEPLNEAKIAATTGIASGALAGLMADLAAGGLTLGAGVITGMLAGALGGAGAARGRNLMMGADRSSVAWSGAFLDTLVRSALLRYMAVAHFGRGRGAYTEGEAPAFWQDEAARVVDERRGDYEALWKDARVAQDRARIEAGLQALLSECAHALLERLYPGTFPRE